jgi:hypothetical protein
VCACVCICGFVSAHVWLHASVYAYIGGRLNQRALLDQHLYRFHVTLLTRQNQRSRTFLPSQQTSVRRSGAAAATQATVHACCMHVCSCIMRDIKQEHVHVFVCNTPLD